MLDLTKNIIYEDDHILVVNKSAGLLVHNTKHSGEPTLSDWFVEKYPESKDVGEPLGDIKRPGIVHRIDKDTSGILILVKTKEAHKSLKNQFKNREVEKIYHLFVYGNIKEDEGRIDLPLGRSKKDFRKKVATRDGTRESLTLFKILKRSQDKQTTFLEARPKTGRTHQLRAHFRALYHPIVSDKLYASGRELLLGFNRLALHARSITFKNVDGKDISLKASYPEDFKHAIDIVGADVLD